MGAWGRGATASALLLGAWAAVATAASLPAVPAFLQSVDEYYEVGDERITLRRSPSEIVVQFTSGDRQQHEQRLAEVTPKLTIVREIQNSGRLFYLMSLDPPEPDVLRGLVSRLAREPGINFVGPVYVDAIRNTRLIPTDEIVARLEPGVSRIELERLASAHSLAITGILPGASQEYVMRLTGNRSRSTLQLARELRRSGLFSWVQPDFIRELQKEAFEDPADVAHLISGAVLWFDIDGGRP